MGITDFFLNKRQRVLVIEDEKTVLKLYLALFKEMDHRVIVATTGKEAIKKLEEEKFTLVILDLVLPDIDGMALLKQIKEKSEDTPIIIVTANPSLESSIEAIRTGGVYDYIVKPFDTDEFKMVIQRAVEKVNLTMENRRLVKKLETANKALSERVDELEKFACLEKDYTAKMDTLKQRIKELEKHMKI